MNILYQDPRAYNQRNSYKFTIAMSLTNQDFNYHVIQNPQLYLIREM